jgi:glycosyltransferase involved in cell wall biosynthesis
VTALRISVIVPAFNEELVIAASLSSVRDGIAGLEEAGHTVELIVCDNNSSDRTAAIAREHGAQVVFEPINQISRARNTGAARAVGDWLVFVDADSHPSRDLLLDAARAMEGGRCIAGGSTVSFDCRDPMLAFLAWTWNTTSRVMGWSAGAFMFCQTAVFRALGGFSTDLYAAEEIEIFRRVKRLARQTGRSVVILTSHPLRTSARKMRLYTRGEMGSFMLRTIARRGRTLRSADECFAWYDGRR